jgi:hypothetical protein
VTGLVGWNPRWFQPGESLWSVANKVAFTACASVSDVLRLLAGVLDRCREGWLFPTTDQAVEVCELMGLPMTAAKGQLFADVRGLPDLREREHWQLAIRYCAHCLAGFVHRTAFQDRRVTCCPVHGTRLLEGCPACGSALDPASKEPWSCAFCGMVLAAPGRFWARQFLQGPTLRSAPEGRPPAPVWPLGMPETLLRRWVGRIAYEEHSAIWSTLLGAHVECTAKDMDLCNVDQMPTVFTCPVAGAAWMSAKTMGIQPQFAGGAWAVKNPSGGAGLTNAVFLVMTLPADQVDGAVRALVRQWALELLEAFAAAAEAGECFADWPEGSFRLPMHDATIYRRLGNLAARAGRCCGFHALKSSRMTKKRS